MRMWESTGPKATGSKSAHANNGRNDADDFYVFLYDEEDKSSFKQATLKQKKTGKGF